MQCSDCRTDLDDALILVCDHNLCLQCAAKRGIPTGFIRCRICSATTSLEPASVQQLREMYPQFTGFPQSNAASVSPSPAPILQRPPLPYIPVQSQSPALSSRSLNLNLALPQTSYTPPVNLTGCGQCEQANAEIRCLQCDEMLCMECCSSLHRRGRMASHQTVPLQYNPTISSTPRSSSASPMSRSSDRSVVTMRSVSCSVHADEVVQYFCLKCETRPMCSECVFRSGEHTNHLQDVVLIKKAFPKVRARINDLVSEFEKSIRDVKLNEVNLGENKKSLDNLNFNCKGQVAKLFDELREAIRAREIEIVGLIESVIEREMKQVEKEIRFNQEKREKIESVFDLINSVRDAGSSSFEKEIEILDSFSEVRTTVSESRAELLRNEVRLVQLYINSDQVARMQTRIDEIRSSVAKIEGIIPANSMSSFDEARSTTSSGSGKRKTAITNRPETSKPVGPTQNDLFLMSAIEDAMRSG